VLVDVIIPTKNRPEQTTRAVQSVLAQTHRDLRVILVDDGSSPQARRALSPVALDQRVMLIQREESGGPQVARQTGLENSVADYVATLDSDDYWAAGKLDAQIGLMVNNPRAAGALSWYVWERDGEVLTVVRPAESEYPHPLVTDNMSCPLFLNSALQSAGGFLPPNVPNPLPGSEHIEFWIRFLGQCVTLGQHIAVAPSVLTFCQSHVGRRESDSLGRLDAAESLEYAVQANDAYLSQFPTEKSLLLARVGSRYLASGSKSLGLRYMRNALVVAPSTAARARIARKFAPHTVKMLFKNGIPETRSAT
jgi:glycosyltransferase involved in cell wall biosynthesis